MPSTSSPAEARGRVGVRRTIALGASLLVGLNLRPSITSVAALLDELGAAFDLSSWQVSLLATLPVIAFGLTAPLGAVLARRVGASQALAWSMLALAAALLLRVIVPHAMLSGTFLGGTAIMAASTVLPQYLKGLSAGGMWVGLSSMSFGVGAAIGAGISVPLADVAGSPGLPLAVWAAPAIAAGVVMLVIAASQERRRPERAQPVFGPGTRITIALVTAVFGLQAMLFFAVTNWLPRILASHGADAATGGWLLALTSVAGLVPTLLAPILARRRRLLRWFGPGLGLALTLPFLLLAVGVTPFAPIVILLGAVQGALFGLALSLIVTSAADSATAGVMSAVAQGAGFAVAGIGSFLLGVIHDLTGDWTASLVLMMVISVLVAAATAAVIRRPPASLFPVTAASVSRAS